MEKKLSAPADKVFALLTDPKWLQERSLALGELSAQCKTRKGPPLTVSMKRRVRRDLPTVVSRVLNPESDIEIEERWTEDDKGYSGELSLQIVGKPISASAPFSLQPEGRGCVYRIQHKAKVSVPLIGVIVEKFILGQIEQGCADELDYLADWLKKNK